MHLDHLLQWLPPLIKNLISLMNVLYLKDDKNTANKRRDKDYMATCRESSGVKVYLSILCL